jgi:hypothetical protein
VKATDAVNYAFAAGVFFAVGMHMFLEDLLGLDRYIAHLRAGWVTLSPAWGASLAAASLIAIIVIAWLVRQ